MCYNRLIGKERSQNADHKHTAIQKLYLSSFLLQCQGLPDRAGIGHEPDTQCARDLDELTEKFHRAVEEYLLACDSAGKKPAQAFTGNFTVRTTPVIHEALTLYALSQETNLAQIMQQAIGEFLANHDIELPNKEEN